MALHPDPDPDALHPVPGESDPGPVSAHSSTPGLAGGSYGVTPSSTLAQAVKSALAKVKAGGYEALNETLNDQGSGLGLHQQPAVPPGGGPAIPDQHHPTPGVHEAPAPHSGVPNPGGKRPRRRLLAKRRATPEPSDRLKTQEKLKARATKLGLPTLPGSGSLTLATRYIEGGRATVLLYIQLAAMNGNDSAMTWWHVWEHLSKYEQSHVSFDDICASSGIPPKNILMAIAGAGFEANCDIANLLASHMHPKVVEASIKEAQKADGIEDRKLLMSHSGFIPVPKGSSIVINNAPQAIAMAKAQSVSMSDPSVPSFLQDIEDLSPVTHQVQGEVIQAQAKELPPAPLDSEWASTLDALAQKQKTG